MMRLRHQAAGPLSLLIVLAVLTSACASGGSTSAVRAGNPARAGAASTTGTIRCADFVKALSDTSYSSPFFEVMNTSSSIFTKSATGQSIRFLAVQPADTSSTEALVFFNGTSQITPDWPIAMLVSGSASLCDDTALVFSDYPGIGDTAQPFSELFTFDNIAHNVYDLLADLDSGSEFEIQTVHPIGWSLGTEAALKFATLASSNKDFAASNMKIGKLFLIATKPGGDLYSGTPTSPLSCSGTSAAKSQQAGAAATTYYTATGSQAMCVTSVLDEMVELDAAEYDVAVSLKESLVGVMFPYFFTGTGASQEPYGPGDPTDICAATLSGDHVTGMCDLDNTPTLTIQSACDDSDSSCSTTYDLYKHNREAYPYTDQILYEQFKGQRRLNYTFDYCHCSGVDDEYWASTGCTVNPNNRDSPYYYPALLVNGSPCTSTLTSSATGTPTVTCPGLAAVSFEGVYVFNGYEDMFVRHDYGEALCDWFNNSSTIPCTLNAYTDTGHGVMYDYSNAIYSVISGAL